MSFDFETGKSTAHHTIIDLDTKKEIKITGKESEPKEKCCIGLSDSNKL